MLNKNTSKEKGVTLIEIIVAIALVALIVTALVPVITHSFGVMKKVKENLDEHFFAQRYVEIIAATNEQCLLADGTTIPIVQGAFPLRVTGQTTRSIVGGYVKRKDVINFLASVPHISINPYRLNEGYLPDNYTGNPPHDTKRSINITGYNTHFRAGTTTCRLADANNNTISGCVLTVSNRTRARLRIPLQMQTSSSPYVTQLQTGTEKVNAILLIQLPERMAVGQDPATGLNRIIISSEDPSYWTARTPPAPATNNLKHVLFYNGSDEPLQNSKYLLTASSGKIFVLQHGSSWKQAITNCSDDINHICWSEAKRMFVAAGNNGVILTSDFKAESFVLRSSGTTANLNSVAWDDINAQFIAIGQRGTIISSSDGINWSNRAPGFTSQDDILSQLQPVLWLDAAQGTETGSDMHSGGGVVIGGHKIQRWNDISGHGNNASVAKPPDKEYDGGGNLVSTTYYGPELVPGLIPGIRFDAYEDHLKIPGTLAPGASARSIFIVAKNQNNTSEQKRFLLLLNYSDPSVATGSSFRITPEIQVRLQGYMNFRPSVLPANQEMLSDSITILCIKNKENAKIKDIRGFVNGSILNPKPDPATAETFINIENTGAGIGASGNPNKTGQFFIGEICEIMVFDRNIDFMGRKRIEKYLADKYAVPATELSDYLQDLAFFRNAGDNINYLRIVGAGILKVSGIAAQYENELVELDCGGNWWDYWNQSVEPGPLMPDEENVKINSIVQCGNQFLAPADKGLLFYQKPTDSAEWHSCSLGSNYSLQRIAYNAANSLYTLIGNDTVTGNGCLWVSNDGLNWSIKHLHDGSSMPALVSIAGQ